MRIALITPGFSASEADWCIPALLDYVRELQSTDEVEVFTLRYPHRRGTYTVYGATVHAFGGAFTRGAARVPLLGRALQAIRWHHAQRPFDVIHACWADEPGAIAVAAGRLLRRPTVVSLLGGELVGLTDIGYGGQLSRGSRWLIRFALRGATCVTVGSHYLADIVQRSAPSVTPVVRPLGVDVSLFTTGPISPPTGWSHRGHHVLHVASLVPVKDQAMLLHAWAQVAREIDQSTLHIVGEGPLRGELEALAQRLGIADSVRWHGAVAHDQLPAFYRSADLCVLSSRFESQSMATLEAAACGCPTVGTAVGLLPDLGRGCQVVPVGDVHALASAIGHVLQDTDLRNEMGATAFQAVQTAYGLSTTVGAMRTLYAHPDHAVTT